MVPFVLRVRLPDRPGALGAVAARIGAVGGDITSVDIVARAGEQATDEFVIELEGDHLVSLLITEVHEVDGVAVEEIRPLSSS